jgi:hypothetical protein
MKRLHAVSAVLELGAGAALLGFPSVTAELLIGAALQGPAPLTVARVGGGGLLAVGLACWLARGDAQSVAARGLVTALLLYNVLVAAVLAYAGLGFGLHGALLWPAVVLHAAMAGWCVAVLVR